MSANVTALVLRALDSLVNGNVDFARELLEIAREEGERERRFRCASCGRWFEWPGALGHHQQIETLCGERLQGAS